MTSHELAQQLLERPNRTVAIGGLGSDAGFTFEVTRIIEMDLHFEPADQDNVLRDHLGYPVAKPAITFLYNK